MKTFLSELRKSLAALAVLGVPLCGVYPVAVWGLSAALFPEEATGSLLSRGGAVSGSRLIGQGFAQPRYFHPRPSSAGEGYDAAQSGGSNLGPTSRRLTEAVAKRVAAYRAENVIPAGTPVPADAVTTSGSGLDPHISPRNAEFQAPRVATARGLSEETVRAMIRAATEGPDLGLFGSPGVNVLRLNLALDERG